MEEAEEAAAAAAAEDELDARPLSCVYSTSIVGAGCRRNDTVSVAERSGTAQQEDGWLRLRARRLAFFSLPRLCVCFPLPLLHRTLDSSSPFATMSKRGTDGVDAGSSAKKSKSASGPVAPAASVSGAQHSGAKKHSHHGPLPLVATGEVKYLPGFGGEHQSEALPNALPVGQNSPQVSDTQSR